MQVPNGSPATYLSRLLILDHGVRISIMLSALSIFLSLADATAAAPGERAAGLQITVRSHEEPSVDGSFTVDFAVTSRIGGPFGLTPAVRFEPGEGCLQEARLTNGGDPPDELGLGERYPGRFEIAYALERRPYSYCRLWLGLRAPGAQRPVIAEPVYVYFTPYETVEVWSADDFDRLNRVWSSPKDRTPRRRRIQKELIPVSDLTDAELASRNTRLRLVSLSGLGYSVPQRIPGSSLARLNVGDGGQLAWFALRGNGLPFLHAGRNLGAAARLPAAENLPPEGKAAAVLGGGQTDPGVERGAGGGVAGSNQFAGTVSGSIFTSVENDFSDPDPTSLDIVGIRVELMLKKSLTDEVIGTAFTREGGVFDIAFDQTKNDPDIEVYLNVTAENELGTIRVRKRLAGARSETHFKDSPHQFLPGTGLDFDFGAIEVDSDGVKPQLLHWANRARSFVEQELGNSILPTSSSDPLDIMRSFSGTGQAYFIPGGYATDAALLSVIVFGPLGLPVGLVLALVVSNNDSIYVGSDRQLDEDVPYHEFGHYLMWHLQAESWLDPLKAGFATHHQVANDEHPELAWTEGFASGFGAIVDAVFQADDGEFGLDGSGFFEDRDDISSGTCTPREGLSWTVTNCGGGSTPNCASGQVLTHGLHSEWNVASMLWDLWDGPSQPGPGLLPLICDEGDLDGDGTFSETELGASFDDGGQDRVELTFQEIVQPLLDNQGSGGFILQGSLLVSDVMEYFTHIRDNPPASLATLASDTARRTIKDVLVCNGIRNLALDVSGAGIVRRSVEADLPNTDELSFERDVTVDYYKLKSNQGSWKFNDAKTNAFSVDVTALLDSNDGYNLGNAGSPVGSLSDDLLVTGQPATGSARLSFNKPGFAGWQSNSNSYGQSMGVLPIVGPSYEARLAGGMTLEVREDASVVLGNGLGTATAEVHVDAGGRLILGRGRLIVNQSSTVIIERGATLEIDVGAEIQLNGPTASLQIHGDLLIRRDAEFTYGGGGYVLFDLPDAGGLPNVTMEPGSSITIEESLFIIQSNTYVKPTEDATTAVTLWYATGELGMQSYFDVSRAALSIEGSTIRATGGAHAGVVVNGYPNQIIDSRFFGGAPCIHALKQGSSPLQVSTSEFAGGTYGILSEGVPVGVGASTFSGFGTAVQVSDATVGLADVQIAASGIGLRTIRGGGGLQDSEIAGCDVGWYATELQGASGVVGGVIRNNILYGIHDNGSYGVQIEAVDAVDFSLDGTDVDDSGIGVSASGPVTVAARCSLVRNNSKSGFHMAHGALLDISNVSGVQITGNPVSIQFDLAALPLLDLGDNTLTPSAGGMTLVGTIDEPCAFGSVILANRNSGAAGIALGASVTNVTDASGTCTFDVQGATIALGVVCP